MNKFKTAIMSKTSKVILSLLGATAIGVTIGMLIAPEKGTEIRKKICDVTGELATKINDIISMGKDKIKETASIITKEAGGAESNISSENA